MKTMNIPGFTAEQSLHQVRGRYYSGRSVAVQLGAVIPAIPRCENCDFILENCENNGWRPRAVCNACNSGRCFSGEENPGGHCRYDHASGGIICDL
jgi:hypothetical protein